MAGNKVNAKNKGKGSKGATSVTDESEEIDSAILRKPIPTSITGFAQARKIFDVASVELKELLTNECDLLYECKVCRNLFRSLANFISHKRIYCKEKFSSSLHSEFVKATTAALELSKIRHIEQGYQEYIKSSESLKPIPEEEQDERVPITKDITDIIERLTKTKGRVNKEEDNQVVLEKIPNSSVAVFQSFTNEDKNSDKMRAEVRELDYILSRDQAVLQPDGKFTTVSSKGLRQGVAVSPAGVGQGVAVSPVGVGQGEGVTSQDSVIQISDDDDSDQRSLKCKICGSQFSTAKTLRFHMKYKHVESRLVYPCPDCFEIFCTSWSVYRHLFKVHRKTAAQIRRLRESIQSKAFKMNNPPMFYEKRKQNAKLAAPQAMTKEEQIDQENQAWMDNMECDGELPRCGGCGRTFERRAALVAHTQVCQPRSRALRRPETKRIEIQIRKDYNKGPSIAIMKATGIQGKSDTNEDSADRKNSDENETNENDEEELEAEDMAAEDATMDVDEDHKSDGSNEDIPEDTTDEKDIDVKHIDRKMTYNLPHAIQAEKSNITAFKQRIDAHVDLKTLYCKKCDVKLTSASKFLTHMAEHFNWKRYTCKLCNFKHFNFKMLPEHVKTVHKLKGDSDFYHSTVKAIDGNDAMILSKSQEDTASEDQDPDEESPESGRPSRCSSDSRLSDDSSSSSHVKEVGSRKRKRKIFPNKAIVKKKKDGHNDEDNDIKNGDVSMDKVLKTIIGGDASTVKTFDENSSDIDETEYKATKRHDTKRSAASQKRPVRNKTKPRNEDFVYDLSNIIKQEAQGYRDSQQPTNKNNPPKKKTTTEPVPQNQQTESNQLISKYQCFGALAVLSRKAVDNATAHMKTANFAVYSIPKERPLNIFARPMIPKATKISPKKDMTTSTENIIAVQNKLMSSEKKIKENEVNRVAEQSNTSTDNKQSVDSTNETVNLTHERLLCNEPIEEQINKTDAKETSQAVNNAYTQLDINAANLNIPAVLPMTIRKQSLEMMKPIIKQNITDFTKAGMKTKILVIKPIKNKDGTRRFNALKYQTIKMKEKGISNDDQAVLVKVPKVTCTNVSEAPTQTNCTTVASLTKIVTSTEINDDIETCNEIAAHTICTVPSFKRSLDAENTDIQNNQDTNTNDSTLEDCNKTDVIENLTNGEIVTNTESHERIEVNQAI